MLVVGHGLDIKDCVITIAASGCDFFGQDKLLPFVT
jgi:hypothetical protein